MRATFSYSSFFILLMVWLDHQSETAIAGMVPMNAPMPAYVGPTTWKSTKNHTILTMMASVNYGGPNLPTGPICSKALEIALDRLNQMPNWLPHYDLRFQMIDDECDEAYATERPISQLRANDVAPNRVPLMITSPCANAGQERVGAVLKHFNFLGLIQDENIPDLEEKRNYFSGTMTMGIIAMNRYIGMADFMAKMGWHRIAIISEIYDFFRAMERTLGNILESRNITLAWMGKITYASQNEEEMSTTFEEMKRREPRVILSNTNAPVSVSCWLHRYGMYGPNYAIFYQHWSFFEAETASIPPAWSKWCTNEMLVDVSGSAFFFGDSTLPELYGENAVVDSTGMNYPQFLSTMQERIDHPEKSGAWPYWRNSCYDQALFAGYILNATEGVLQSKNQTLSDWTTNTKAFQERGTEMVAIMREAIFAMDKVKGYKGIYKYKAVDPNVNLFGFAAGTVAQRLPYQSKQIVAYFSSNDRAYSLVVFPGMPKWRTVDGKPLADALHLFRVTMRTLKVDQQNPLVVIALMFIVICCIFIVIVFFKGKLFAILPAESRLQQNLTFFNIDDFFTNLGNIIMLIHIPVLFAQGFTLSTANTCIVIAALLSFGFATSSVGIWCSFMRACYAIQKIPLVVAIWLPIQASLLAAWLALGPIGSIDDIEAIIPSMTDSSIAYEMHRPQCILTLNTVTLYGLFGAFAALHLGMFGHCVILAVAIKAITQHHASAFIPAEHVRRKSMIMGIYCMILLFAAGILIAVLNPTNGPYIEILVATLTICYTLLSIYFFGIAKLIVSDKLPPVLTPHHTTVAQHTARHQKSQTPGPSYQGHAKLSLRRSGPPGGGRLSPQPYHE